MVLHKLSLDKAIPPRLVKVGQIIWLVLKRLRRPEKGFRPNQNICYRVPERSSLRWAPARAGNSFAVRRLGKEGPWATI